MFRGFLSFLQSLTFWPILVWRPDCFQHTTPCNDFSICPINMPFAPRKNNFFVGHLLTSLQNSCKKTLETIHKCLQVKLFRKREQKLLPKKKVMILHISSFLFLRRLSHFHYNTIQQGGLPMSNPGLFPRWFWTPLQDHFSPLKGFMCGLDSL